MIEFILNNDIIRTDIKTGTTLLSFIRENQGLKGTKSGCKEGDCGACTVLSGELNENGDMDYKSIVSCLTPLANAHNKHIVTVEGLNLKNELNIAQLAIKEHHGTQCGFCTPGFVVSLTNFAIDKNTITTAKDHISGNICRCTGYKSIEKAAESIEHQLKHKNINDDLNWLIENKFIPTYFKEIPSKLQKLNTIQPKVDGQLIAGGTDINVRFANEMADQNINPTNNFVSKEISFKEKICTIGAGATVSDIYNNEILNKYFPDLKKHLKLVSSMQIRNMGTIAGNFVNASPIGDMSIFFLALDADIEIENKDKTRRNIKLKEFFKDYKQFDLSENEVIQNIKFELPDNNSFFNFEKVSKRTHLDIASVNTSINLKVIDNLINNADISIGGVAAIPKYLGKTSGFLKNKKLTIETIIEAQNILQKEISPIDDIRGTSQYKRILARQLFYAHFIELFPKEFKLESFI